MRRWQVPLLAAVAACTSEWQIKAAAPNPVIRHAPLTATDWPVTPMESGWLIGGSGYRLGNGAPFDVRPGIGLSLALTPSRQAGNWLGIPGTLPAPLPYRMPFPVWTAPGAAAPSPGPPVLTAWTKAGLTELPGPVAAPWPADPWLMSPWGPVALAPKPAAATLDMGFPMADGTPASRAFMPPSQKRRADGRNDIMFLDLVSRAIFRPPNLLTMTDPVLMDFGAGFSLVSEPGDDGDLMLIEYLGGGIDPLPELQGVRAPGRVASSQRAAFIAFTALRDGRRQIQLFDRRTRMINPLSRLNGAGEVFEPFVDGQARLIAHVRSVGGQTDIALYDTLTGLTDPLVAVNTPANEHWPTLSFDGRWLCYITEESGGGALRLFDRATGTIDTLPDVNRQGPVLRARLSLDALGIVIAFATPEGPQVRAYLRPSGITDPLPELNR